MKLGWPEPMTILAIIGTLAFWAAILWPLLR